MDETIVKLYVEFAKEQLIYREHEACFGKTDISIADAEYFRAFFFHPFFSFSFSHSSMDSMSILSTQLAFTNIYFY
jgi:hypothetical protein